MQNYFSADFGQRNKKIEKFMAGTKKELDLFFGIDMWQPFVILLNSRKDFDKLLGEKTEDWFVGYASGCNLFVLDEKKMAFESSHKKKGYFWKLLKHEYCHLYFKQITGGECPKWLNEGLACFLADLVKKIPDKDEVLKVFDYYEKIDRKIYQVGYFWVWALMEKFGKEKPVELIKSLNPETGPTQFAKKFKKIYGFAFNKKELKNLEESLIKNT